MNRGFGTLATHSIIVVRQDDGTAYTVDWSPLDGLTRNRILESAKGALAFGARVSVTGAPIRTAAEIRGFFPDFKGEVNPRTIDPWVIRRVGDTFSWALPQVPDPAKCADPQSPLLLDRRGQGGKTEVR